MRRNSVQKRAYLTFATVAAKWGGFDDDDDDEMLLEAAESAELAAFSEAEPISGSFTDNIGVSVEPMAPVADEPMPGPSTGWIEVDRPSCGVGRSCDNVSPDNDEAADQELVDFSWDDESDIERLSKYEGGWVVTKRG